MDGPLPASVTIHTHSSCCASITVHRISIPQPPPVVSPERPAVPEPYSKHLLKKEVVHTVYHTCSKTNHSLNPRGNTICSSSECECGNLDSVCMQLLNQFILIISYDMYYIQLSLSLFLNLEVSAYCWGGVKMSRRLP